MHVKVQIAGPMSALKALSSAISGAHAKFVCRKVHDRGSVLPGVALPNGGRNPRRPLEPVADQDRVVITWRSEIAERGISTPGCCNG